MIILFWQSAKPEIMESYLWMHLTGHTKSRNQSIITSRECILSYNFGAEFRKRWKKDGATNLERLSVIFL